MPKGILRGEIELMLRAVGNVQLQRVCALGKRRLAALKSEKILCRRFTLAELVIICTGFRGADADGRFLFLRALGSWGQHRCFAVVKNEHSGGKRRIVTGFAAVHVEYGTFGADRRGCQSRNGLTVDIAAGGGRAANGTGGDAHRGCVLTREKNAVPGGDLAGRVHGDSDAARSGVGLYAVNAAGDAHIVLHGQRGIAACERNGGRGIRHADRTLAFERKTAARNNDGGQIGTLRICGGEIHGVSAEIERNVSFDLQRLRERGVGGERKISAAGNLRQIVGPLGCQRRHRQQRDCHQHGEQKSHQFLCHKEFLLENGAAQSSAVCFLTIRRTRGRKGFLCPRIFRYFLFPDFTVRLRRARRQARRSRRADPRRAQSGA